MKKNVSTLVSSFACLFALCSVLLLGGCLSAATQVAYDAGAPPEKLCTVNFVTTLTVKKFDGKDVNWKAGFGDSWASVRIPEGSHTFVADYQRNVQGGYYHTEDVSFTYNGFKAGHTYEIVGDQGESAFWNLFADVPWTPLDVGVSGLKIGIRDTTGMK